MTTRYRGIARRGAYDHRVEVSRDGGPWEPLPQRQDVANRSPTGLSWGYAGSGPAQLALALLCDAVGEYRAQRVYQPFKIRHVATLSQSDDWAMTREQVEAWAAGIEAERGLSPVPDLDDLEGIVLRLERIQDQCINYLVGDDLPDERDVPHVIAAGETVLGELRQAVTAMLGPNAGETFLGAPTFDTADKYHTPFDDAVGEFADRLLAIGAHLNRVMGWGMPGEPSRPAGASVQDLLLFDLLAQQALGKAEKVRALVPSD